MALNPHTTAMFPSPRTVTLFLLFFAFSSAAAQPLSMHDVPFGTEFTVRLENNSDTTVTFFPLLQQVPTAPKDLFRSADKLIGWVSDACKDPKVPGCATAMAKRLASVMKTDIWTNGLAYPSFTEHQGRDREQSFAKDYSLVGALTGSYHLQGGNLAQLAALILHRTGKVKQENMRMAGGYSQGWLEVRDGGDWVVMDFDPNSPMFMSKSGMSRTELKGMGWPAVRSELKLHTYASVFTNDKKATANDFSGIIADENHIADAWKSYYMQLIDSVSVDQPAFFDTDDMGSELTLPAGAHLEVTYRHAGMFIDTVKFPTLFKELNAVIDDCISSMHKGDTARAEKRFGDFMALVAGHFSLGVDSAGQLLSDGHIRFDDGKWRPWFNRDFVPFYTLVIPAGSHEIGRDIKAPGKVLGITAGKGSNVNLSDAFGNDTQIAGGGKYRVGFWNSGDGRSRPLPLRENHYLQKGTIQAVDTVRIDVSWNPAIFNFLHGKLELSYVHGGPIEVKYPVIGN